MINQETLIMLIAAALVAVLGIGLIIKKHNKPARDSVLRLIEKYTQDLSALEQRYISLSQLTSLQQNYRETYNSARRYRGRQFSDFVQEYRELPNNVKKHNAIFVTSEVSSCAQLFDNVEGKSLDQQQRVAIVTDEDHNLVIAGAGAGKTLTIVGKVKYLCERQRIAPDDILLIAFAKKAAEEMSSRISDKMGYAVEAVTFHKLGLDIITQAEKKRPDVFDDKDFRLFMEDFFKRRIAGHPQTIESLVTYFAYYINIPAEMEQFSSTGEAYEYEKNSDLETMRSKYLGAKMTEGKDTKRTLKGEFVKSIEELEIANFLFLHGVKYEYERLYPYETDQYRKQYRPDFYLPDYDIYYEHFGVNKSFCLPWLTPIEEKKYLEGISWKRSLHQKNGTKLIETYSWYQHEGILLDQLKTILEKNGVVLRDPNYMDFFEKIYSIYSNIGDRYFSEFISLCSSFTQLFKSNGYSVSDLRGLDYKSKEYNTRFHRERLRLFKSIIETVLLDYEELLRGQRKIDFSDMINKAAENVRNGFPVHPYKYVIVDEYQDIALSRNNLLNAILESTGAHLLCVGDDWQSIYRFTGSDIDLFTGFEKHYAGTEIMRIERTYRNSQQLIDTASNFITKNPSQFKKSLHSSKQCATPVHFLMYQKSKDSAIKKAVEQIIRKYGKKSSILFLGRTNYELDALMETNLFSYGKEKGALVYRDCPEIPISFLTVHRSKGLEADNVIILNFNNAMLGFPNKISDDPILELVLSTADTFLYGEERRLLYVALTRTRNEVFLVTSQTRPSEFLQDFENEPNAEQIPLDYSQSKNISCPACKTGKLIEKIGPYSKFVGCTNYPACTFKVQDLSVLTNPIKCRSCGGLMVKRRGQRGEFYGCSNYPTCKHTMEIKH